MNSNFGDLFYHKIVSNSNITGFWKRLIWIESWSKIVIHDLSILFLARSVHKIHICIYPYITIYYNSNKLDDWHQSCGKFNPKWLLNWHQFRWSIDFDTFPGYWATPSRWLGQRPMDENKTVKWLNTISYYCFLCLSIPKWLSRILDTKSH